MQLEVITGPMFSGKSEELLRRLRRHDIAGKRVSVIKPKLDTRYHATNVVSHAGAEAAAIAVHSPEVMFNQHSPLYHENWDVLGIDEAQFFEVPFPRQASVISPASRGWVDALVDLPPGKRVIIAGLDMDFQGQPFLSMKDAMAIAHDVQKLKAICTFEFAAHRCGSDATNSQRIVDGSPVTHGDQILVGGTESYEARCPRCFTRKDN